MESLGLFLFSLLPLCIYLVFLYYQGKAKYRNSSDSNKMIVDTLTKGTIVNGGREYRGIRIQGRSVGLTDEAASEIYKRAVAQLSHLKIKK